MRKVPFEPIDDSDQTVHPAWAVISVRPKHTWIIGFLRTPIEDTDQVVYIHRLICVFTGHLQAGWSASSLIALAITYMCFSNWSSVESFHLEKVYTFIITGKHPDQRVHLLNVIKDCYLSRLFLRMCVCTYIHTCIHARTLARSHATKPPR